VKDVIPYTAKARTCIKMVLIIDQGGTSSSAFLTRLDLVLRAFRRNPAAVGGIALLVAGELLQLAPPLGCYSFLSDVWALVFGDRAVILNTK